MNNEREYNKHPKIYFELCGMAYLKKSSLQNSCPFFRKHLSARVASHSTHLRQRECHVRSTTFRINRSRIIPSQPAHLGIVAEKTRKYLSRYLYLWSNMVYISNKFHAFFTERNEFINLDHLEKLIDYFSSIRYEFTRIKG